MSPVCGIFKDGLRLYVLDTAHCTLHTAPAPAPAPAHVQDGGGKMNIDIVLLAIIQGVFPQEDAKGSLNPLLNVAFSIIQL